MKKLTSVIFFLKSTGPIKNSKILWHGLLVRAWTLLILLIAGTLPAKIISVSPDGPTTSIQVAINSADVGDEIVVSTGTYHENLFINKDIILRSTNPQNWDTVTSTIIDGGFAAPVILFSGDQTSSCVVSGLTITHGLSNISFLPYAGGIEGRNSSPTLEYNFITENASFGRIKNQPGDQVWEGGRGGGIGNCHGLIQHNRIHDNYTDESGGGLRDCDGTIQYNEITSNTTEILFPLFNKGGGLHDCDGIIFNNIISNNQSRTGGGLFACDKEIIKNFITNNSASSDAGGLSGCGGLIERNIISFNSSVSNGGGALGCSGEIKNNIIFRNTCGNIGPGLGICQGLIINNTIIFNISPTNFGNGGGLGFCQGATIKNNIIWGNNAANGPQIDQSSPPTYCLIQDWTEGGEGNITSPPLFVDADNDNFHLLPESPAIDRGTSIGLTTDFDGHPRPFDIQGVGFDGEGFGFDIGADEFVPIYFLIREHILGTQTIDNFNTLTLDTNIDQEINVPDILFEIRPGN